MERGGGITVQRTVGKGRRRARPSFFRIFRLLRLHPLFCALGIWYACSGELFLFLLSTLVALQHECAHAFAAAKLGYRLNAVVLMPFGALIDVDLKGISFQDEIFVALCGPLCNLVTAVVFVALWWFFPTLYAFTDVAFYSSMAIGLVNLLPAYPLDGGRILQCALARIFAKTQTEQAKAEKKAARICRAITLLFALSLLALFVLLSIDGRWNFTLLAFGSFLFVGALGNRDKQAIYQKIDFSFHPDLRKGVEIRRVAVSARSPLKEALRFLSRGSYLVLEIYDEEGLLFTLSQNELSALFLKNPPYARLGELGKNAQK